LCSCCCALPPHPAPSWGRISTKKIHRWRGRGGFMLVAFFFNCIRK
jgi:hypothetical protein